MKEATAEARPTAAGESKLGIWTGRILSALLILFFILDGVTKLVREKHTLAAAAQLGYSAPAHAMFWIGVVLLFCTALYAVPRTATLGAILLTGYLGGAAAITSHADMPPFECAFPVIFGVLVWLALFLRDAELRAIIPLRR